MSLGLAQQILLEKLWKSHMGLEPTNRKIMTWAEVGRPTDCATQAPLPSSFFNPQFTLGWMGLSSEIAEHLLKEILRMC